MTIEEKVIQYQNTYNERLFEEIYEEIEGLIKLKMKRYQNHPEVISDLNLAVFQCVIKYDIKKNDNFRAFLGQYTNFSIKKSLSKHKAYLESEVINSFDLQEGCEEFIMMEQRANLDDLSVHLQLTLEERFLLDSLSKGLRKSDVAALLKCTASNICFKIRSLKSKYPELQSYFEE